MIDLSKILNLIEENQILFQRMGRLIQADFEFGVAQLGADLNADINVPPTDALNFLKGRVNSIKDVNQSTFNRLREQLMEGLASGESFEQLAARVKQVYSASDSRAETVAITETNVAVNSGRYTAMQRAGVEKKAWRTANLANVRPTHKQAGRDYSTGIPIDQPFIVGGEALMHPGDPKGSPANVINCRCFSIPVIEEKSVAVEIPLTWEKWAAVTAIGPADLSDLAYNASEAATPPDLEPQPCDQNAT